MKQLALAFLLLFAFLIMTAYAVAAIGTHEEAPTVNTVWIPIPGPGNPNKPC